MWKYRLSSFSNANLGSVSFLRFIFIEKISHMNVLDHFQYCEFEADGSGNYYAVSAASV